MPKVFFIAEAGKNFIDHDWKQGAMPPAYYAERAAKLAKAAKDAGADAVKFQTHVLGDEREARAEARHAWIGFNESITPAGFWKGLKEECDRLGIEFMTTPMSRLAARKTDEFVSRWKVGSGNVTDVPLLEYLASTGKPVILSTGMSTHKQVQEALRILNDPPNRDVSLLYCKSVYPCPRDSVDLGSIGLMERAFGLPVGFSDHTVEVSMPARAAAAGARIVEKHFTLDKGAFGPDHSFALTPEELGLAVRVMRDYEDPGESAVGPPDDDEIRHWINFRKNQRHA